MIVTIIVTIIARTSLGNVRGDYSENIRPLDKEFWDTLCFWGLEGLAGPGFWVWGSGI